MFELKISPVADAPATERGSYLGRLEAIREGLMALGPEDAAARFGLLPEDRLLKTTIGLCAECLVHVPAAVYVRAGRVLMGKRCPAHGAATAVVENDASYYSLSSKDVWGRRYADERLVDIPPFEGGGCCDGGACGEPGASRVWNDGPFADQLPNKSCTVLLEATSECNLACPVCYSDAKGSRRISLEDFKRQVLRLIEAKGGLDALQLTGGEAAMHPDFWKMMDFLHAEPRLKKIGLPTNGLLFANPAAADRLARCKDKVIAYLQFDASAVDANRALRAADTRAVREKVVGLLSERGVAMQLTMTLARGVNDDEVGWVTDVGLRHANVKAVAIQPAFFSGRYDLPPDPMERTTLSDAAKAVLTQARLRMGAEDFVPIPCSHPNCGWITLFVRRFGLTVGLMRFVDWPTAAKRAAYKTLMSTEELRGAVGGGAGGVLAGLAERLGKKLIRSSDIFAVAIKPFMDRFTYDQDRVANCCHHILDAEGRPVSFCEYNARLRPPR